MFSWREVHDFSQPLTIEPKDCGPDEEITYGVAKMLLMIVWDRETGQRRAVPMRWGFPHANDWRRPQPIHARSENIDATKAFAKAFGESQRGVVVFKTFNEGEETHTSGGKRAGTVAEENEQSLNTWILRCMERCVLETKRGPMAASFVRQFTHQLLWKSSTHIEDTDDSEDLSQDEASDE